MGEPMRCKIDQSDAFIGRTVNCLHGTDASGRVSRRAPGIGTVDAAAATA